MLAVKKKDGSPRIVIDYTHLNKQCQRETYPNPRSFDIATSVLQGAYKTVADAYRVYHQVELDEESCDLTTFITLSESTYARRSHILG